MDVCFFAKGCVMNQADHFDMDRDDALRELGFQRQALRAVAARALLHDVPGDPDRLNEDDQAESAECARCHGDGRDPWSDYLLPCPVCVGSL